MRIEDKTYTISQYFDYAARILFLVIAAVIVISVVLRLLGSPVDGAHEWVGFLTASAVGLALSYCAAQKGHVSVTILAERLSKRNQLYLDIIAQVVVLIILFFVVRSLVLYGNRMVIGGQVGMTTQVPLYYFAYIIALGFTGYFLVVLSALINSVKKVIKK